MKQEELLEEVVDASSLAAGIGPSKEPRKKEEELVKFYRWRAGKTYGICLQFSIAGAIGFHGGNFSR
ncbi:hypothetical protein POTOM_054352 [Populus tomentosa]|uniref:Uncharacterized protein n=1 Tax=Populus tomentosa TaxID=118781 RepID=A0A8X7XZL2_POPTO|nr:hypothetical protein POTOM_054352 [Populus tomentosa]